MKSICRMVKNREEGAGGNEAKKGGRRNGEKGVVRYFGILILKLTWNA